MLPMILAVAQASAHTARTNPLDDLVAAEAIASYELPSWRKLHPKADLALTYANATVTAPMAMAVRKRLGLTSELAVLDPTVLTIVLQSASRSSARRLQAEAYVFLGSFPKGYRALCVVERGKRPKVVSRTIVQRYEMRTLAPIKKAPPKT